MISGSIFAKNTNSLRCDNPIGKPFFELSEVDSSNNYAMRMAQAQLAGHGATWFAHFQKAGKGQRGKQWKAEPGQNIMMSCIVEPKGVSIENQFILNAAVALACFDLFNNYAIDQTSIKWPNDLYWGDRKAGGILIENILKGEKWKYSIVGIGININQTLFPEGVRNPVSLKQITGRTFNVVELAKELCECLENRWQQLLSKFYYQILAEYCSHLYKINQEAVFKKENAVFNAIVKGVNKKGELLIQTDNETSIGLGAVEWVLP